VDDNTDTIMRNTKTLIDTSKQGGLEVNTETNKYMLLPGSKYEEKSCSQLSTYFKRHVGFREADESLVYSDKT
jgi:hypothetical protein